MQLTMLRIAADRPKTLAGHAKHKMSHKGHYAIAAAILLSGIAIALRPAGPEVNTTSGDSGAGRVQLVSHGASVLIIDTIGGKTWQK
jgi:hypothetical protein